MSISTTEFTVADVQLPLEKVPVVNPRTMLKQTLELMSQLRLGIACVVDDDGHMQGVFTDGDMRRILLKDQKPFSALFVDDIITHAHTDATTTGPDVSLAKAIEVMEEKEIWDLPVVRDDGVLVGLLHLHPAIKAVMGL